MEEHTSTVSVVRKACCALHNICIDIRHCNEIDLVCDEDCDSLITDGNVQMRTNNKKDAIMEYI